MHTERDHKPLGPTKWAMNLQKVKNSQGIHDSRNKILANNSLWAKANFKSAV